MKIPAWSFSSIKSFEQCPKKYYHLRVAKDFQEDDNKEHLVYGKRFHEAAEKYIRDNEPLPPEFNFVKGALDNLSKLPGEKLCEFKMGLKEDLSACGFFDPEVWWRGVADLIILDETSGEARVLDYKTGKSTKYADTGQLEMMALAVFKHFPTIKKVKAGLLFVIAKDLVKANYHVDNEEKMWSKWLKDYERMKSAYINDVWNPRPSGLCRKHCVVTSCPHNGANL